MTIGILQHEVIELVLAFLGAAREAVADLLDVILDFRVLQDLPGLAHAREPPHAGPVLIVERHGGGGRAAEIRQILIDGARARAQARRPRPR